MFRVILSSIFLLGALLTVGQCDTLRYNSPIFNVIDITNDVEYGQAPQWSFPYFNEALLMDIYQPLLDPIEKNHA